ncbi:MAG: hypothetical protein M1371_07850 [Actinobacteria bacterium]|nr:hypothetical protein [Actinomycetota bacterium]
MRNITNLYNVYQELSEIEKHLLNFESDRSDFSSVRMAYAYAIEVSKFSSNSNSDLFFKLASSLERALGLIHKFSITVNDDIIDTLLECVEELENMVTHSIKLGKTKFNIHSLILGLKNFYHEN